MLLLLWGNKEISFLRMTVSRNKEYGKQNKCCGSQSCVHLQCVWLPGYNKYNNPALPSLWLSFMKSTLLKRFIKSSKIRAWPGHPHLPQTAQVGPVLSVCHTHCSEQEILSNQTAQIRRLIPQRHRPHLYTFRGLGIAAGFATPGQFPWRS